ncbi:VOC family protein [Riemerella anatipestifer]|nr:VOC family protein [Riemerella anatipestifer]
MIKGIYACWIYVSDLELSIKFYQEIGFNLKLIEGDWAEFEFNGVSFALLKRPIEKGKVVPIKTRIMFEVDDIFSIYNILSEKSVKMIGGVKKESYGNLLTFEDIDGHWLEFFEKKV